MKSLFQVEWSLPTTIAIVVKTLRDTREKLVKKFRTRETEKEGGGGIKNEE